MTEQQYPEPTCGALIFNAEEKILLIKSHKWKGKYIIPGGHVELGEKFEDTLKREIKEETGLDIYDIKFICFQEFIYGEEFWKKKHFIFFDFACKTNSTDINLNSEGQEFVWVPLEEALKLPVDSYTKKTIEKYINNVSERSEPNKSSTNTVKETDVTKWLVKLEPLLELTEPSTGKGEQLLENARAYVKDCHHWMKEGNLVLAFECMVHAFAIFETCKELGVFAVRED